MKKILSIALIAALVATSVFATTFKGSATVKADYNLDTAVYGIHNASESSLDWALVLEEGEGASAGEGDVYAEIKGTFNVKYDYTGDNKLKASGDVAPKATLKVESATVHVKEVAIDILGSGASADFAKNFKSDDNKHSESSYAGGLKMTEGHGVKVSYDKYTVGVGLEGDADDDKIEALVYVNAVDVAVAEGLTVKAAGAVKVVNDDVAAVVNAGTTYTNEDAKVTATVAADVDVLDGVAADVAGKVTYADYTAEAFFGYKEGQKESELAAKASAKFGDVTVTAQGYDLLEEANRNVGGKVAYAKAPVEASVEAMYKVKAEELKVTVAGKYTAEACTVEGKVIVENTKADTKVSPSCKVSSTKVVNNATVSLEWAGAAIAKEAKDAYGTVTAALTVAF